MKRKYIVAVLLFYVLGVCTLFSVKIEKAMMTQATAVTVDTIEKKDIPITALFRDESGNHLYYAEEGLGWLEGLRVQECEDYNYTVDHYRQSIDVGFLWNQTVILSASRQPKIDERVNILWERQRVADRYLFLFTEEISPEDFAEKALLQSGKAFLTEEPDAKAPFLEKEAKDRQESFSRQEYRIYSLNDAEQMAQSLPEIASVVALSFLPVLLLMFTCIAPQKKPTLFWINLFLSAAALAGAAFILPKIQLPPSWMPAENIFDFAHYRAVFAQIRGGLQALQYEKTLDIFARAHTDTVWAAVAAACISLLAVGAEVWAWKRLQKKQEA